MTVSENVCDQLLEEFKGLLQDLQEKPQDRAAIPLRLATENCIEVFQKSRERRAAAAKQAEETANLIHIDRIIPVYPTGSRTRAGWMKPENAALLMTDGFKAGLTIRVILPEYILLTSKKREAGKQITLIFTGKQEGVRLLMNAVATHRKSGKK